MEGECTHTFRARGMDVQKIQAEGYGDMVIQRLQGLRRNMELCDFKVSADGRVFEVPSFLSVSQYSVSPPLMLALSSVWKILKNN